MTDIPAIIDTNELTDEQKQELQQQIHEQAKIELRRRFLQYKPYKKQQLFHTLGGTKRERALMAGNQVGKGLLKNQTLILKCSSNGLTEWVLAKDIKVGDYLIDGQGNPTKVIGVYPHDKMEAFRVTFDDGASVVCDIDHRWKAKMHKKEKFPSYEYYTGGWGVYDMRDIIEFGGYNPCPRKRAYIPVCEKINTPNVYLPVDPYFLGQYLGNGTFANSTLCVCDPDDTAEALENITGVPIHKIGRCTYKVDDDEIKVSLIELNLQGKRSWEKFIPQQYLHASHEQRKALLQGLMDTDGSCAAGTDDQTGGACEYSTASEQLAKDVTELARSLGCKVKTQVRKTWYTYQDEKREGRVSYRLKIRCPFFNPFRLERKAKNWFRPTSTTDCRVLYSIEPLGKQDTVCFTVDSPDSTFIIQDYIVTHNTHAAAYEMAFHLTGRYPEWWQGKRFDRPITAWAGGVTSISVRDILQDKLFGQDWRTLDHGILLPQDVVDEPIMAKGVTGLIDTIKIRHSSGGISTLQFKSYEQGRTKWQGVGRDVIWLDEEPDQDIYTEALARTNATKGILFATFTPLFGMSQVVTQYWEQGPYDPADPNGTNVKKDKYNPDRALVLMGIRDVDHYTEEERQRIINSYPAFEREARANGIPSLGSGRVFKVAEEAISVPFIPEIPPHWPRIAGIDIGWDHPTAVSWLAWDRDTDVVYLYDCYKVSETTIAEHASRIKKRGDWIPVAWPHDALQADKQSGTQIADLYRAEGVNMLYERATMEMPDGTLTSSVEATLMMMEQRMLDGRFKVASHLKEWFEEFNIYHRKDGKIVKEKDDLISSTRYAMMMLRYAETESNGSNAYVPPPDTSWIV